jgi:hypothetical protein
MLRTATVNEYMLCVQIYKTKLSIDLKNTRNIFEKELNLRSCNHGMNH